MRPVKQFGVVSTHSLQSFAPAASLGVGASLMLTHVTRFAFMFISAAMLVYAYPAVGRGGWRTFWRRRLLAVVLPYATWTVIYFAASLAQPACPGTSPTMPATWAGCCSRATTSCTSWSCCCSST